MTKAARTASADAPTKPILLDKGVLLEPRRQQTPPAGCRRLDPQLRPSFALAKLNFGKTAAAAKLWRGRCSHDARRRCCLRRQQPPERRGHSGQRRRDRRKHLIVFPPAAERLVEYHELRCGGLLRRHVLLLDFIFLTLRVDHIERIRQSPVEPLGRERNGASGGGDGIGQVAQALLLRRIGIERGVHFAEGVEHRALVVEQKLAGAKVRLFHEGIKSTKVQERRGDSGPGRPDRIDGQGTQARSLLRAERAGNRELRKKIGGSDADKSGGARQFALRLDNVGTPAQQVDGQAGANAGGQCRKRCRLRQLLAEAFGEFAEENRYYVTRRVDLRGKRGDLRLQLRQLALR